MVYIHFVYESLVFFGYYSVLVSLDFNLTLPDHQTGTGAIVMLPTYHWSNAEEYGGIDHMALTGIQTAKLSTRRRLHIYRTRKRTVDV